MIRSLISHGTTSVNSLFVFTAIAAILGLGFVSDQYVRADECVRCCVELAGKRCFFTNADGKTSVAANCRTGSVSKCDVTINSDGSCSAVAGCKSEDDLTPF